MIDTKKLRYYLKRFGGTAAVIAAFAAAIYSASADDIRLLRQLDNNYDGIMLLSENAVGAAVVNINTASVHHLQRINGIGETRARAIVEYREAHGGFKSVDELVNVSGIGEKTLEAMRDKLTV